MRLPCFQKHICLGSPWGGFGVIFQTPFPRLASVLHGLMCATGRHQCRPQHYWCFWVPSPYCWKLAGHPRRPIGEVTQWYCPLPGMVNAVRGWESSSNCICQKPEVRSRVEKMVEFARPMSPMHSVISFMLYLSMCKWLFSSLKSCTIRRPRPCFWAHKTVVSCRGNLFF